jgi:hypothetical protein
VTKLDDEFKSAARAAGRMLKNMGGIPAPRRARRKTKKLTGETVAQALARITPNWKRNGR